MYIFKLNNLNLIYVYIQVKYMYIFKLNNLNLIYVYIQLIFLDVYFIIKWIIKNI